MKRRTSSVRTKGGSRLNPLKSDPTRLATLRRAFTVELLKELDTIKAEVYKLIAVEDIFGLRQTGPIHPLDLFKPPTRNRQFAYETSEGKVKRFRAWIRQQFDMKLTGRSQEELWRVYIQRGYEAGATRAFKEASQSTKSVSSQSLIDSSTVHLSGPISLFGKSSFTIPGGLSPLSGKTSQIPPLSFPAQIMGQGDAARSSLLSGVTVEKVKLLAGRTFSEMEDMTSRMATKMSRRLADGFVRGDTADKIAKDMANEVDITKGRALTIVRTELTRAHAEGQLDALEGLGYEDVTASVEWTTSRLSTVCELCQPLEGVVLKISEARGMLPRHPNCLCSWTITGEETGQKQRVSKPTIDRAIKSSLEEAGQTKQDWGPGKTISKKRPQV